MARPVQCATHDRNTPIVVNVGEVLINQRSRPLTPCLKPLTRPAYRAYIGRCRDVALCRRMVTLSPEFSGLLQADIFTPVPAWQIIDNSIDAKWM